MTNEWTKWNRYIWTQKIIAEYIKSPQQSTKPWAKYVKILNNQFLAIDSRIIVPIEQVESTIKREYEDIKTGYVGRDKLFERLFKKYIGVSRRDIADVLSKLEAHIRTQPQKKGKVSKPIVVLTRNSHWQMDLIDLSKYDEENLGNRWVLNIVDLFSKYLISRPLVRKEGKLIANALEDILSNPSTRPKILQSDNGSEFKNSDVEAVLKRYGITQVFSKPYSPTSQGAIEKVNQTLKLMLKRLWATKKNHQWISALPDLVSNYNTSIHSVTRSSPISLQYDSLNGKVADQKAQNKAQDGIKQQAHSFTAGSMSNLKEGDYVRLALKKKGNGKLEFNWSKRVYLIKKIIHAKQPWAVDRYQVGDHVYGGQQLLKVAGKTIKTEKNLIGLPLIAPK